MELIRLTVATVTGLLLAGGYLASVSAFFSGTTAQYSEAIDRSMLPMLSLVLLLVTVVLAFIPGKADADGDGEAEG